MKRLEKPDFTQVMTTFYILMAAKAAAATAAIVTVIRTERIFIKLKILDLEK